MSYYFFFPQFEHTYATIASQAVYNVTLPMILAEWQKLYGSSVQFGALLLDRLPGELGEGYWMSWASWNITYDVAETLLERSFWHSSPCDYVPVIPVSIEGHTF